MKPTYPVLAAAIIDAGNPDRMFVPPALLHDVLEIVAGRSVYFNAPVGLLGAQIHVDDKLPENEIAFGFGETKPLRERLVLT